MHALSSDLRIALSLITYSIAFLFAFSMALPASLIISAWMISTGLVAIFIFRWQKNAPK